MTWRGEVSPGRRVLELLALLTRHPGQVFDDEALLRSVGGYGQGPNAARSLRMDKRALEARGLIVTNQPTTRSIRRRGIKRAPILQKPGTLTLTREEHHALQEARRLQSDGVLPVGPSEELTQLVGRKNQRADQILQLLRLVEEFDGEVPLRVVAASLGVSHRVAQRRIRELCDAFDSHGTIDVEPSYTRDADDITEQDISGVRLQRHPGEPSSPLSGGTEFLGLFAYSRREIAERLDLIERFKRQHVSNPEVAAILDSVANKLQAWERWL